VSKAEVFIIESLNPGEDHFDGKMLSDFLKMSHKKPKYRTVRNITELKAALRAFKESNYRYLHISAHGAVERTGDPAWGLSLSNGQTIDFKALSKLLKPCLIKKRLFLSSCSMVNMNCAKSIIKPVGCYSIVGPTTTIGFDDCAVFWISLYHLMFKIERKK